MHMHGTAIECTSVDWARKNAAGGVVLQLDGGGLCVS